MAFSHVRIGGPLQPRHGAYVTIRRSVSDLDTVVRAQEMPAVHCADPAGPGRRVVPRDAR